MSSDRILPANLESERAVRGRHNKRQEGVTVAKHIEFENDGETVYGRPESLVKSKSGGNVLARIVWYPRWRQWVCEPVPNTIWSQDCLADMREYMLSLPNNALTGRRKKIDVERAKKASCSAEAIAAYAKYVTANAAANYAEAARKAINSTQAWPARALRR